MSLVKVKSATRLPQWREMPGQKLCPFPLPPRSATGHLPELRLAFDTGAFSLWFLSRLWFASKVLVFGMCGFLTVCGGTVHGVSLHVIPKQTPPVCGMQQACCRVGLAAIPSS